MKFLFLPLGALFGFLLSRGGATTYDFYAKLFLFEDAQLFWVIATAIVVGAPLLQLLKHNYVFQKCTRITRSHCSLQRKVRN